MKYCHFYFEYAKQQTSFLKKSLTGFHLRSGLVQFWCEVRRTIRGCRKP